MITEQLISPKSIVVVGGSDDTTKPGGNALANLLKTNYKGKLYVVNPKSANVQGHITYKSIEDLPQVDCAILAIPAKLCVDAVESLCSKKGCKAIIIFSAGFHEDGPQGAILEKKIVESVNKYDASLIGPNCIGVITPNYAGVFTHPISNLSPNGIDIISGSGATVVFIMEAAIMHGLTFSHVFSVGNSAQIGVEDVLKYLDETYVPGVSSPVKLLYIESINNPNMLMKHAKSLISKGAKIAAIKAGYSEAGSRAASSHTGALASPDKAVSALFRKAGIIRAYSRGELVNIASILKFPKPKGDRIAIITHAGGPAVMLTDILSSNGIQIPKIAGPKAEELLQKLFPGSSVNNPIDFLATGTAEQLEHIIDACNNDFDVDAMAIIFGSPGLTDVSDVYEVLYKKLQTTKKPIYPILPSIVNAKEAIEKYQAMGGISFNEEVAFGKAFVDTVNTPAPQKDIIQPAVDKQIIRTIIDSCENGYLLPLQVQQILDAAGINRAKEAVVNTIEEALESVHEIGYPIVMKVIGPIHKTDVGGVSLNIADDNTMATEFTRMMTIKDTTAILLQPMLKGTEIFIGAKKEGNFGTIVMCGLGGIFIEALKDVNSELIPIAKEEAQEMIKNLKGYKIIKGIRGLEGVNETLFNETIRRVSALCTVAPEIAEMDLNPLLGNSKTVTAVDARIRIEK
ncbi:MAG: acetate--CoA ligase family protein [Bacteroidales bacterium]